MLLAPRIFTELHLVRDVYADSRVYAMQMDLGAKPAEKTLDHLEIAKYAIKPYNSNVKTPMNVKNKWYY